MTDRSSFRPTDLPELRDELVTWSQSEIGRSYWEYIAENNPESAGVGISTDALQRAELYFVAEDMMQLAVHASASIPDFALDPDDLPSPAGFLYTPMRWWTFTDAEGDDPDTDLEGFAWGVLPNGVTAVTPDHPDGRTVPAIEVTFLTNRDRALSASKYEGSRDLLIRNLPRLYEVQSCAVWEFGVSLVEDRKLVEAAGLNTSPALIMKAVWVLMQQTVAAVGEATLDRATRKRLERKAIDPAKVRIISLRRPASPGGTGEAGREWQHQWIVRGHWRQQWYPARQVHRPVWIAPHLKGPEGKPLLGGDKVYNWKR